LWQLQCSHILLLLLLLLLLPPPLPLMTLCCVHL
jgi:hypothetical protein